jgi:hypothetical protein
MGDLLQTYHDIPASADVHVRLVWADRTSTSDKAGDLS